MHSLIFGPKPWDLHAYVCWGGDSSDDDGSSDGGGFGYGGDDGASTGYGGAAYGGGSSSSGGYDDGWGGTDFGGSDGWGGSYDDGWGGTDWGDDGWGGTDFGDGSDDGWGGTDFGGSDGWGGDSFNDAFNDSFNDSFSDSALGIGGDDSGYSDVAGGSVGDMGDFGGLEGLGGLGSTAPGQASAFSDDSRTDPDADQTDQAQSSSLAGGIDAAVNAGFNMGNFAVDPQTGQVSTQIGDQAVDFDAGLPSTYGHTGTGQFSVDSYGGGGAFGNNVDAGLTSLADYNDQNSLGLGLGLPSSSNVSQSLTLGGTFSPYDEVNDLAYAQGYRDFDIDRGPAFDASPSYSLGQADALVDFSERAFADQSNNFADQIGSRLSDPEPIDLSDPTPDPIDVEAPFTGYNYDIASLTPNATPSGFVGFGELGAPYDTTGMTALSDLNASARAAGRAGNIEAQADYATVAANLAADIIEADRAQNAQLTEDQAHALSEQADEIIGSREDALSGITTSPLETATDLTGPNDPMSNQGLGIAGDAMTGITSSVMDLAQDLSLPSPEIAGPFDEPYQDFGPQAYDMPSGFEQPGFTEADLAQFTQNAPIDPSGYSQISNFAAKGDRGDLFSNTSNVAAKTDALTDLGSLYGGYPSQFTDPAAVPGLAVQAPTVAEASQFNAATDPSLSAADLGQYSTPTSIAGLDPAMAVENTVQSLESQGITVTNIDENGYVHGVTNQDIDVVADIFTGEITTLNEGPSLGLNVADLANPDDPYPGYSSNLGEIAQGFMDDPYAIPGSQYDPGSIDPAGTGFIGDIPFSDPDIEPETQIGATQQTQPEPQDELIPGFTQGVNKAIDLVTSPGAQYLGGMNAMNAEFPGIYDPLDPNYENTPFGPFDGGDDGHYGGQPVDTDGDGEDDGEIIETPEGPIIIEYPDPRPYLMPNDYPAFIPDNYGGLQGFQPNTQLAFQATGGSPFGNQTQYADPFPWVGAYSSGGGAFA